MPKQCRYKELKRRKAIRNAHAYGATVEFRRRQLSSQNTWWFSVPEPSWDWNTYDYRIREGWGE